MQASTRPNPGKRGRRGIVLVLVLGMLALMALIGITFATFSGQSRISARNFFQSMNQPQRDELMDYALSQLISDTPNRQSAIRGHSLARDMYGNDASSNGYIPYRPDGAFMPPQGDSNFYITDVTAGTGTQYLLTTNIPSIDPTFYGYNFTRWSLRVAFNPNLTYNGNLTLTNNGTGVINQTLEVLADSGYGNANYTYRTFTVNIGSTEGNSNASATPPILPTTLNNPTAGSVTQLPGQYFIAAAGGTLSGAWQFILDGRWLHAFNGPGMGPANAIHANFRYNGLNPNAQGMDEDYDAVDLENWFLAMQSADGSVMIPSFHRPSAIRIDPTNGYYDWGGPTNTTPTWNDSASRILRPRAADGHDASAFPDLLPGPNGQITYDVDNDGDGVTDSVWVDLGYPARRNAQGQLYKPLFSFMVIGLNGRIPLNTAGNLAGSVPGIPFPLFPPPTYYYGQGAVHAAHLGNSVSEVDPTYALQNAYDPNYDALGAFNYPPAINTVNTQVDNVGIDVRVTQLRNLLAGTRPPQKTTFGTGTDGDTNFVSVETASGSGVPSQFPMPNGVADPQDNAFGTDGNGFPVVLSATPPVAGRWGEAGSVPGGVYAPSLPNPPAINNYVNLLHVNYFNSVRAGYSYDTNDILSSLTNTTPLLRDAADDNLNAFDPYPPGHTGELNDQDYYDAAGALILPVDRMRRYVTPADINGTGSVNPWTSGTSAGADPLGRVNFYSYYRPPGSPGSVTPYVATPPPTTGAIYYPTSPPGNTYFYSNGPNNNTNTPAIVSPYFLPDVTNNPLHAFEFFRLPPIVSVTPHTTITNHVLTTPTPPLTFAFQFQQNRNPAMPLDQTMDVQGHGFPISFPTYDSQVNSNEHTDGLNDADEMNLYGPNLQAGTLFGALAASVQAAKVGYVPNVQADTPFCPSDLEWLYRQQDVDGTSLTSRLAQLAPVSFTNPVDGQRRRRLFTTDSWEMNNFAWTNDNPYNAFPTNHTFALNANAGFPYLGAAPGLPTPPLAHRDKKINLNYPLPVSNDPNEPIRQKWISDAYQLLKSVLPPKSVDTADELAELSQFLVNVIDFRDPDCTMTHFRNPDVEVVLGSISGSTYNTTYLAPIGQPIPAANTAIPLDQYGMEYNPIAINEAIAYSFQTSPGTTNRFYVELVNTLSQTAIGLLPANAFGPTITNPPDVSMLDLSLANYDLVMTADDPVSRPDPFTGQLLPIASANYFGQIPFNQQLPGSPNPLFTTAGDVQLTPLFSLGPPANVPAAVDFNTSANYFYSIANPNPGGEPNAAPGTVTLTGTYDPLVAPSSSLPVPPNVVPPGYCPNLAAIGGGPTTTPTTQGPPVPGKPLQLPPYIPQIGSRATLYYWICLRRPANPFAPPQPDPTQTDATGHSTYNPMVVVDALRFPYIEGTGTSSSNENMIYSSQRCQPFRGGHAVRLPGDTGITTTAPLYTPYGYSEQMAVPQTQRTGSKPDTGNNSSGTAVTQPIWHTIGLPNDQAEPWDYFPFNDRDFTSVAELMLVPGCPPGLFTKQFVELPPMPPAASGTPGVPLTQFPVPTPPPNPPQLPGPNTNNPPVVWPNGAVAFPPGATGTSPAGVAQPHTYPYLVDKFFYSGYGGAGSTSTPPPDPGNVVDGYGGDGWFKMFEFFEVPSQSLGAIGQVASGTDFDWLRQDLKPGLLNLNLIIDEEVFFSILGSQSIQLANGVKGMNTDSFSQLLLNFAQLPASTSTIPDLDIPQVVTSSLASGAPAPNGSVPIWGFGGSHPAVVTNDLISSGNNAFNGLKAAFAQFLILRHGANLSPTGNWLLFSANAERPFHSLSYPDINYTVMRPANLPPATPILPVPGPYPPPSPGPYYTQDPGVRNFYINPWGPPSGILSGGVYVANTFAGGTLFSGVATNVSMPSPIPARRLFQIPDAYTNGVATTFPPTPPPMPTQTTTASVSNASDAGDPFINVVPVTAPANLAAGALGTVTGNTGTWYVNNGYPNLVWSGNSPAVTVPTGSYLGANNKNNPDYSQHPYWRSEMMQKVMNLTTVRTHQYAVWITIGFFEVKREGDLGMIQQGVPLLAFDLLGPEIGAASGQTTRYRGFFLVDRTKLYGFDDTTTGSFTPAVVYREMIE